MIRVEMCRQADKSRDYSKHSAEKLEDKINDAIVAIQVETYKGNGQSVQAYNKPFKQDF